MLHIILHPFHDCLNAELHLTDCCTGMLKIKHCIQLRIIIAHGDFAAAFQARNIGENIDQKSRVDRYSGKERRGQNGNTAATSQAFQVFHAFGGFRNVFSRRLRKK